MLNAEYDAELWVGASEWPAGIAARRVDFDAWGVGWEEFQIGGGFCHHQPFFGVCLEVPRADPLAALGHSYLSTNLPGPWNPDYATPLEELLFLGDGLGRLGLKLDPVSYWKFAEAYLPIEPESGWLYAVSRGFRVRVRERREASLEAVDCEEVGLATLGDVVERLSLAWTEIEGRFGGMRNSYPPDVWHAVLHYPNSD